MTTNMQERLKEKFPLQQLHEYHELTGHLAKDGEMLAFIQSEIDIAVAKREGELVEEIEGVKKEIRRKEGDNINLWSDTGKVIYYYINEIINLIKTK